MLEIYYLIVHHDINSKDITTTSNYIFHTIFEDIAYEFLLSNTYSEKKLDPFLIMSIHFMGKNGLKWKFLKFGESS